jgi:Mg2+-importing ATPase
LFLFALALALGLTPQLLPVIISTNLSRGVKNIDDNNVIVKNSYHYKILVV